ncbi:MULTISPECIES: hypothetical protein [Burkholderia]|uniref:Uncharacterized protein n=1 Tax=Burkholderia anthina TaxID=179879 RepID=A0A7T7AG09_9BURK|nr:MULTISPECIES: hypothetical protein [Burkholderia]MBY4866091.1 hypothetical protein [Burkholderia anthina]QQK01261.1 hypothetical protein JFN94_09010 [Burkholderia anthina]
MSVNREILLARGVPAASRAVMLWRGVSRFCRSAVFLSLSFSPCEARRQTTEHFCTEIIGAKQAGQGFRQNIKHIDRLDFAIIHSIAHATPHYRANIEIKRLRDAIKRAQSVDQSASQIAAAMRPVTRSRRYE